MSQRYPTKQDHAPDLKIGSLGEKIGCANRAKVALHNPGCNWGLNPPVSSRDRAM